MKERGEVYKEMQDRQKYNVCLKVKIIFHDY